MYWHIDTDIVSLLVILVLYIYTVRMLATDELTAKNRSFLYCLGAGIVMTVIDIAASVIMEVQTTRFLFHLFMGLYLAVIELAIVAWFYYSLSILYHGNEALRKRAARLIGIPYGIYLLLVISNPWTNIFYTLGADMAYTRGALFLPLMVGLYAAYALALFILIFARLRHIPAGYPRSVLFTTPIILTIAIPVQLLNAGWLMVLPAYMLCLVMAFLFLQNVRVRNERALLRQLSDMVENFTCGLSICNISKDKELTVRYINKGMAAIVEADNEELLERYQSDILTGVHPDDRDMVRSNLHELADKLTDGEFTYRYVTDADKLKWIHVNAKVTPNADGSATLYATYTDLTEQKRLQKQQSDIIQNVPCGISLFRWDENELQPLLVNSRLTEMLGEDAFTYLSGVKDFYYTHVHPEDLEWLRGEIYAALTNTTTINTTYRSLNLLTNEYLWVRMRGKTLEGDDGAKLVIVSFNDVTAEHNTERQLRESERTLEFAAEQAGLLYWRYDAENDILTLDDRNQIAAGLPGVMENFLTDWLPKSHILPEYFDVYRDACRRIKEGEPQVVFEIQRYYTDGRLHWARYCLTNLPGNDGRTAIGTSIFIDTEKELWVKYELERKRTALAENNLLAYAVFDLSAAKTLEYRYRDGGDVPLEDRTAFTYGPHNAYLLIDDAEREQFLALNDATALLSRFEKGETGHKLEYRRLLPNGDVNWVRSVLNLVRDPRSGNVLVFEYWYDIEEEKMLELMYRSIASDNYDFVARIDGRTRKFTVIPKEGLIYHMPPLSGTDADEVAMSIYEGSVVPEDYEFAIENSLVANINKNLRENGRHQFTYRELRPNGEIRYKRMTQYYVDPQREIIAMLREDVTELIRSEMEKNAILADALETANQASSAKSQFLSRVSHELRTPLNAIIGFMELAKSADRQSVEAYLNNSNIAAKQLLSIINDVLDVSAIESGKMKIAHAPFDFKHLIHSITNIYVTQCAQKGLAYETRILTPIDEWLMGDQLRVNQILLNLLNNAVKFTAEGHVWLSVSQHDAQSDKAFIRFTVSDTGCGMSEQMLSRIFKPFEQESATTAQKFGGNGLGLSIVNSLVNMMGGVISVKSKLGEGSVFTVDLPFIRGEAESAMKQLEGVEDLNVLVVDDEEAEREYVSTVLNRIGVKHFCVASGDIALLELARADAADEAYNVCLVDWRMPNMNGIETAKRIREKYGDNVIVIVVSAYEHYQADESVKAAGANMFVSKPLFQSSLFNLFVTLTGGRIARKENVPMEQNFRGRRVLLAEDNALNRMVAEGLINMKFEAECDAAIDGCEAVDKFLASEPGYYDAILMDIQMPNMDGFEATRRIRESEHPDAKRVHIIALTANAFNEDVAKSLASGMNSHVAKPIDPAKLAEALNKAFSAG